MEFQESQNISELFEALVTAQGQFGVPKRSKEVSVKPRDQSKQSYKFSYATLHDIVEAVRKPLADNGLAFTQIVSFSFVYGEGGAYVLTTRLIHRSGQWLSSKVPLIITGNGNQELGSAVTFMKRYMLSSMLGVVADDDDDANAADGNQIEAMQDRKPRAPQPDVMDAPHVNPRAQQKPPPKSVNIIPDEIPELGSSQRPIPGTLPVPLLPDQSGSDWTEWGRQLLAILKECQSVAELEEWVNLNAAARNTMQAEAARLYGHLTKRIVSARADIESKGTQNAAE